MGFLDYLLTSYLSIVRVYLWLILLQLYHKDLIFPCNFIAGNCNLPKCKFYHYPTVSVPNFFATNLYNQIGEDILPSGISDQGPHGLVGIIPNISLPTVP